MKNYLLVLVLLLSFNVYSQTQEVLFIGNSYTNTNNLPQIVHDIALSVEDSLIFNSHTPGGTDFMDHATSASTHDKINLSDWDYVVLQGQSQEPSLSDSEVESEVFPFVEILCDSIRANNTCSMPIFYMTWGRENGDANNCASWPPVCTYEGMDSLLNLRYRMMADSNAALVSPVGAVWHILRDQYPGMDLYASDGSHPSQIGSYAAACTFYSIIFQKDPSLTSYNYVLDEDVANIIRQVVKVIVYDDLAEWNVGKFTPTAGFSFDQNQSEVSFTNNSYQANSHHWDFGDGTSSTEINPNHSYEDIGTYEVQLIASKCGISDTTSTQISVQVVATEDILSSKQSMQVFPNPSTSGFLTIQFPTENQTSDFSLYLFDIHGIVVQEIEIKKSQESVQIDTSQLASGIYMISTSDDRCKPQFISIL